LIVIIRQFEPFTEPKSSNGRDYFDSYVLIGKVDYEASAKNYNND
jgi:hypothetical protein